MADFAHGSVAIIGGHLHQHGGAAGPVAFKRDFVDLAAFQFAGAAHDGALDVVGGHAGGLGVGDGFAQTGVGVRVAAAGTGGNHDFLDDARKHFPALGVGGGLLVLDGRPFGMS